MGKLKLEQDPRMKEKYRSYPPKVRKKIKMLRQLILDVAEENEEVNALEETLKWGEPSFLAKKGSTIRIDWKTKTPDQYAMYFKCTRLIHLRKYTGILLNMRQRVLSYLTLKMKCQKRN